VDESTSSRRTKLEDPSCKPSQTSLFPPHECYIEACAGGGALLSMWPQIAPVQALNDLNGDPVTFYRVMQDHL
jgi:site-specific DNA-adenine methylase